MRTILPVLVLGTSIFINACSDNQSGSQPETTPPPAEVEHHHQHVQGPNGGDLVPFGDGAGKIEWMLDPVEGVMFVWGHTADPIPKPVDFDQAPALITTHGEEPLQLSATRPLDTWQIRHPVFSEGGGFHAGTLTVDIAGMSHEIHIHQH